MAVARSRAPESGTDQLRSALESNRDRLVDLLTDCEARDAAALARELRMTLKDLADLAAPARGSTVDALAARRAVRQSSAEGS